MKLKENEIGEQINEIRKGIRFQTTNQLVEYSVDWWHQKILEEKVEFDRMWSLEPHFSPLWAGLSRDGNETEVHNPIWNLIDRRI